MPNLPNVTEMPEACKEKTMWRQFLTTVYRARRDLAPACFPNPTLPVIPLRFLLSALSLTLTSAWLPLATGPLHVLFSSPEMMPLLLLSWLQVAAPMSLPQEAGSLTSLPAYIGHARSPLFLAHLPFFNLFVQLLDKCLTSC